MVWIDKAIIVVIGFSCLVGLIRGFVHEVLSLVTWASAFFIAIRYYSYLSIHFIDFSNELIKNTSAILVLFIATLISGAIIGLVITQLIEKSGLLEMNRVLGVFFGGLRGILVITAILFFFDVFTGFSKSETWQKSYLIPQLDIIKWFFNYLLTKFIVFIQSLMNFNIFFIKVIKIQNCIGIVRFLIY